nr:unnamed protein product [Spirometra erinaceieuropaei]
MSAERCDDDDAGHVAKAFAATNGMKQGCVLASNPFSLMFSAMLMDVYRDERPGIHIAHRSDGHLLNSRRMQNRTRLPMTKFHDLLFAEDCSLNTTTEVDMQRAWTSSPPETWDDLAQNRPAWRREMKAVAAIYEANSIVAAKAKRETRQSHVPRLLNANRPPLVTCPRCPRAFRALISLVGHLRTQCAIYPTTSTSSPTLLPAANHAPTAIPVAADQTVADPPPPSSSDTIYSRRVPSPLEEDYVKKIALAHGKTPGQVLLRHAIQRGISVIANSRNPERIKANFSIFDFSLTDEEMEVLNTSGRNIRVFTVPMAVGHPEYPFNTEY